MVLIPQKIYGRILKTLYCWQGDGGGIRGMIPARINYDLERFLKSYNLTQYDIFSYFYGTSTGAILAGMLANGMKMYNGDGTGLWELYRYQGAKLFKRTKLGRIPFLRPIAKNGAKYDRDSMFKVLKTYAGVKTLGDLKRNFVATAFNLSSKRTHFIESSKRLHQSFRLVDVISWSALSAANYFGKILAPKYFWKQSYQVEPDFMAKGAVFNDGGQGTKNCTAADMVKTVLIGDQMAINADRVVFLSFGCGEQLKYEPFDDVEGIGMVGQVKDYLGGQARNESTWGSVNEAEFLCRKLGKMFGKEFVFKRYDAVISEKLDALDALGYVPEFDDIGKKISPSLIQFMEQEQKTWIK